MTNVFFNPSIPLFLSMMTAMRRLEGDKKQILVSCEVCLLASTGKSLRIELYDRNPKPAVYYVGLNVLNNVLQRGKKQPP